MEGGLGPLCLCLCFETEAPDSGGCDFSSSIAGFGLVGLFRFKLAREAHLFTRKQRQQRDRRTAHANPKEKKRAVREMQLKPNKTKQGAVPASFLRNRSN